jgi:hypothetical protein
MKKRLFKVEVFADAGIAVRDKSLTWIVDDITGSDAIRYVKDEILSFREGYDIERIKRLSMTATYLQDA